MSIAYIVCPCTFELLGPGCSLVSLYGPFRWQRVIDILTTSGGGGTVLHSMGLGKFVASSPGHSQILSRGRGEKSGEGLGSKLCHGPETVDSVCT